MSLGKETFELNKKEFTSRIDGIVKNYRCNSRVIGEARSFVIRACSLTSQWKKLATDPDTKVYLRNVDIANGGRKVKMICLERGGTRQPVSKSKLLDNLYPAKKIATTATPEEKHYNSVRSAMRNAIQWQLTKFRDYSEYPLRCRLTGKRLLRGMRTDVDHYGMPLAQIADNFLSEKGLRYIDILLVGPQTNKRFKDKGLWEEWQNYHLEHCKLSIVCASANRSKGADGYVTPKEIIGSYQSLDSDGDISLDF
ncbi:hypothetical protein SCBWM1_gp123 [Synechococcus phage S-CBWM1]|uniref:Uncharacterized protein n=1 Tax=Synechococcus phage S-CBWM1 TaxID=2053653 RepID=A0A3G1L3Q9_9CAUD|nr:hypothetical protein HOU61_gp074 [Synechococcus phage S-CBWM1]ATW62807.1 hypothetical protein SCBWM1_gp123 [Synechococcus phage S-CBWM1]